MQHHIVWCLLLSVISPTIFTQVSQYQLSWFYNYPKRSYQTSQLTTNLGLNQNTLTTMNNNLLNRQTSATINTYQNSFSTIYSRQDDSSRIDNTIATDLIDLDNLNSQQIQLSQKSLLYPTPYYTKKFDQFSQQYGKRYYGSQFQYRKFIYWQNVRNINNFNQKTDRFFNKGINQFTDCEESEFLQMFASLLQDTNHQVRFLQIIDQSQVSNNITNNSSQEIKNPDQIISWKCYAGPIANQGTCGSCYAFACSDALATLYTIYDPATFFHIPLSVQQLISCNIPLLADGCKGGLLEHTYDYIKQNGITTQFVYPYQSAFVLSPPPCNELKAASHNKRRITEYRRLQNNCQVIVQALKSQPLAVGISSRNLQFYSEGVYQFNLSFPITDHAVLLIGYDPIKGFQIKNMWGRTWGMLGYAWVSYEKNAGICSRAIEVDLPPQIGKTLNRC